MRRNAGTDAAPSNLFTDGDPNTSTPASVLNADWFNIIQEELANLVEGAGLVVDQGNDFATNDKTQVLQAIQVLASGGGGGGGFKWTEKPGVAPVKDNENGEDVYLYDAGEDQRLVAYLKVPQGYQTGKQISMYISLYSTSAVGTVLFKTLATLIKKNTDSVNTTTNQHTSTNNALTNSSANQYREALLDLCDGSGQINGQDIDPGDLIRVELYRDADADTTTVRLIPNATEVKFA